LALNDIFLESRGTRDKLYRLADRVRIFSVKLYSETTLSFFNTPAGGKREFVVGAEWRTFRNRANQRLHRPSSWQANTFVRANGVLAADVGPSRDESVTSRCDVRTSNVWPTRRVSSEHIEREIDWNSRVVNLFRNWNCVFQQTFWLSTFQSAPAWSVCASVRTIRVHFSKRAERRSYDTDDDATRTRFVYGFVECFFYYSYSPATVQTDTIICHVGITSHGGESDLKRECITSAIAIRYSR